MGDNIDGGILLRAGTTIFMPFEKGAEMATDDVVITGLQVKGNGNLNRITEKPVLFGEPGLCNRDNRESN